MYMKFVIIGKNTTVTPGLKAAVEDKIGKLSKYFDEDTTAHVTLSVVREEQKVEVTIPVKGTIPLDGLTEEQASTLKFIYKSFKNQRQ